MHELLDWKRRKLKKNNFNSYKLFERFVKASALLCANNAASIRVHYFYRVHNVNSPWPSREHNAFITMSNIILRKDSCNVNSHWPSRIKIGFYFFKDICVMIRCAGTCTCKLLFLTLSYGSLLRQVQYKIIYHAFNRNKYCALVQSFSFICNFSRLKAKKNSDKTQKVSDYTEIGLRLNEKICV